jgi:phosphatidylinositol alpha-1,6-mannosyltransferase
VRQTLGDVKIILFVGALSKWHSYKGLDVLIKAFASANKLRRDMALLVVGDGSLKPTYQKLASKLRLSDNALFAGNVSDENLPSYYAASDMLILPSKDRSEGFGLTILEANACGKPAIGSNVGGIPNVIHHGYNGLLVPPNNPEVLSAAITRLAENGSLRREMGRNGRRFAEEHDWSKVAEATEKIYLEALG